MYQVKDTRYLTSLLQNTDGSKNSKLHYLDGANRYLLAIYETWLKHPVTLPVTDLQRNRTFLVDFQPTERASDLRDFAGLGVNVQRREAVVDVCACSAQQKRSSLVARRVAVVQNKYRQHSDDITAVTRRRRRPPCDDDEVPCTVRALCRRADSRSRPRRTARTRLSIWTATSHAIRRHVAADTH